MKLIKYKGEAKPISYWAKKFNLKPTTIHARLNLGWDPERVVTFKVKKGRPKNQDFWNKIILSPQDEWIKSQINGLCHSRNRCVYIVFKGRKYGLGRFILNAPKGLVVDHINRNILDNRRENLRICTHSDNSRNRGANKNRKQKYFGVRKDYRTIGSRKWQAYSNYNKRFKSLGYYKTAKEAAIVRDRFVSKHYTGFAVLNFQNCGEKRP